MLSDDERREIARKLRGIKDTREGCGHELCCDLWSAIFECGYRCTGLCDECEVAVLDSLAELIEPTRNCSEPTRNYGECDRDALLALADDMETCVVERLNHSGGCDYISGAEYARRIREALGEE